MDRKRKTPRFEVLPSGEMRARFGLTAENRPTIRLDPRRVPEQLHHLIPLAEQFGVSDDLIRADIVSKSTPAERAALRAVVEVHDHHLDAWLAGPEAERPDPSDEYIAFSCLRMAAELL